MRIRCRSFLYPSNGFSFFFPSPNTPYHFQSFIFSTLRRSNLFFLFIIGRKLFPPPGGPGRCLSFLSRPIFSACRRPVASQFDLSPLFLCIKSTAFPFSLFAERSLSFPLFFGRFVPLDAMFAPSSAWMWMLAQNPLSLVGAIFTRDISLPPFFPSTSLPLFSRGGIRAFFLNV